MEEIPNNHLGCKKQCDNLAINWYRISSINSRCVKLEHFQRFLGFKNLKNAKKNIETTS